VEVNVSEGGSGRSPRFRPIPTRDHVLLSSWAKWRQYGRFPCKFMLHILLLIVMTWQVVQFNVRDAAYIRAANRNWFYYFFPDNYDFKESNMYLYSVDDTVLSVKRANENYKKIVRSSVDQLVHPEGEICVHKQHCKDAQLVVKRYSNPLSSLFGSAPLASFSDTTTISKYWINEHDLGPLDIDRRSYNNVSGFIESVVWMKLQFYLVSIGPARSGRACLLWLIELEYDFRERGQLQLGLSSDIVQNCGKALDGSALYNNPVHRLNIAIIVLSVWNILLCLRSIFFSWRLLCKVERRRARHRQPLGENLLSGMGDDLNTHETQENDSYSSHRRSIDDDDDEDVHAFNRRFDGDRVPRNTQDEQASFTCQDRLRFFNLWFILSVFTSLVNIVNAAYSLNDNQQFSPDREWERILWGMGCALIWINSIAFLAHKPSYYTIILTLTRAVPRVGRFLLGVVPILLGYALFGMLYFGDHSERFGSFGMSMITLFAVLNGDVIRETFMELIPSYPVTSQIYLYTFICLFIYVVLNVFIAIVEESFFSTRAKARSLELYVKQFERREGTGAAKTRERSVSEEAKTTTGIYGHSYQWEQDSTHEDREHRKLKWFRKVLSEIDNEGTI